MKSKIIPGLFSILFFLFIIFLSELSTRLLFPGINCQDTQLSLFQEQVFGDSFGWRPNAIGTSFDDKVVIDELGFRKMAVPDHSNVSWLILGDSITFGVGVKTESTFVGLLQKECPNTRIWNTAVVGYAIENYKDVINYFIETKKGIQKVLLFYSLNDLYKSINFRPTVSGIKKLFFFFKQNSKFYMLIKNLLFDRSKSYFFYDSNLYEENEPNFVEATKILKEINNQLKLNDIDFLIVILPYEYQIRSKEDKFLIPQKILGKKFEEFGISYIDAYEYFVKPGKDSRTFYLYADPMHFSITGHKVIFDMLRKKLIKETYN